MKRILMIAYYFPPVAGGGVQRSLKFCKYLPGLGWKPFVLTVREPYDYYGDDSLERDIHPDVQICRSASIEPMKMIRKWLRKKSALRSQISENRVVQQGGVKKHAWLLTLKESLFIPDGEIGWLPFAVLKGWSVIRKYKIDLIYSTSCPYTSHLIALMLKKLCRIPWVADFRDPWSVVSRRYGLSWRLLVDEWLERRVLYRADRVIAVTEPIVHDFQAVYPSGKYGVITNGYDEADFVNVGKNRYNQKKFTVTYTGILYENRSPAVFLKAVNRMLDQQPGLRKMISIRIVGQLDNPGETFNSEILKSMHLDDVVEVIPYVSHRESIEYAMSSDVLLLIVDSCEGNEGIMTGKIFEYLRCRKPILALAPAGGVAAKVVHKTQSGLVVSPDSAKEIQHALNRLYTAYQQNKISSFCRSGDIEIYSRYRLTEHLARLCDTMVL